MSDQQPKRLIATGPARDELVVHTEVWTPDDFEALRRQLAGQGVPARPA